MPALIAIELTLAQLRDRFNITRSSEASFFAEWFAPYSELTEAEQMALNRVQQNYLSQLDVQFGQESPSYDFSDTFSLLNHGNDLFKVLCILKRIAAAL